MPFYEGQPVPLTFTLTDVNGNAVQAAATPPVLTVTQPDGTTATPPVTWNAGPKNYTATGPSGQAGHFGASWSCADATYPGGFTDAYNVRPPAETGILSFADAKRTLRIAASDASEDDFITEFLRAATDVVEWWCGPVVRQAVTEKLPATGLVVQLSKPPVIGLTAWTTIPAGLANAGIAVPSPPSPMFPVRVFGIAYPLTQLYADPVMGTVTHTSGLPFYYGDYIWSYMAGRPVVAECILAGARVILKHLFGMERGGQGGSGSMAADEETTMTPIGYAVPNRALEVMAPQARPAAIA